MAMNPETNRFELVKTTAEQDDAELNRQESMLMQALKTGMEQPLYRADGSEIPKHWSTFRAGEEVLIKGYWFKVAYIGETAILFEPSRPADIDERMPPESESK